MGADRPTTDSRLSQLGIRFRVWYQLFDASQGWHAKGRFVRATAGRADTPANRQRALAALALVASVTALTWKRPAARER